MTDNPANSAKGKYVPTSPHLPHCVIVDLDGALATTTGRDRYDWHRIDEDMVNEPVAEFVNHWYSTVEQEVVILSERDMAAFGPTQRWLKKKGIPYTELFMRAEGDMRPDWLVKREMFYQSIHERYASQLVITGRQQVVDMWRYEVGLPVWQVAENVF